MQHAKENLKHLIATGEGTMTDEEKKELEGYDKYRQEFIAAMDDDLNTADAISAIFELITAINTDVRNGASKEFAEKCLDILMELASVVGLLQKEEDDLVDEDIQALVDERQEARKAKDFARADEIPRPSQSKGHHTERHAAGCTDHQGVSFAESCEGLTGNESRKYQRNQYDGTGVHGRCCI